MATSPALSRVTPAGDPQSWDAPGRAGVWEEGGAPQSCLATGRLWLPVTLCKPRSRSGHRGNPCFWPPVVVNPAGITSQVFAFKDASCLIPSLPVPVPAPAPCLSPGATLAASPGPHSCMSARCQHRHRLLRASAPGCALAHRCPYAHHRHGPWWQPAATTVYADSRHPH